jgi:outer membrane protein assembly factor BamB
MNHTQNIEAIDDERVLVCEYNRVAEYNLKTGKLLWHYNCNNPNSAQRLPNGNTLITLMNEPPNGRIIELTSDGEIVWEYRSKDPSLRPVRAWRR